MTGATLLTIFEMICYLMGLADLRALEGTAMMALLIQRMVRRMVE